MCTVSWMHELDGYQLFCNRDEKRSRAEADPPRTLHRDGVRFLAPLDSECGGTWIATNQFGISLCLLNGTAAQATPGYRSRGLLVLDLIPSASLADLAHRMSFRDLSPFQPFTLLALEPNGPPSSTVGMDTACLSLETAISLCPCVLRPLIPTPLPAAAGDSSPRCRPDPAGYTAVSCWHSTAAMPRCGAPARHACTGWTSRPEVSPGSP